MYFWISAFDHRAIVVPKMHIVQCQPCPDLSDKLFSHPSPPSPPNSIKISFPPSPTGPSHPNSAPRCGSLRNPLPLPLLPPAGTNPTSIKVPFSPVDHFSSLLRLRRCWSVGETVIALEPFLSFSLQTSSSTAVFPGSNTYKRNFTLTAVII